MGDDFNVNVGEVRAHAQTVGNIAATVSSVASSATDSVSGGAFGQIAEFFASAITGAADVVRQSVNNAGQTVGQVQTGLTHVADAYQATEDDHVRVFEVAAAGMTAKKAKKIRKKSDELNQTVNSVTGAIKSVSEGLSGPTNRR